MHQTSHSVFTNHETQLDLKPGDDVIMISPVESPAFPSDRTPTGSWPEGVSPFNARTSSLSSLEVCCLHLKTRVKLYVDGKHF